MVLGEGPTPCDWLILGEAPGATEEEAGRPFVGRSGALLRDALRAAKAPPAFITNAYKLRPPGNRNPTSDELAEHRQYLERDFAATGARRVLAVGSIPLHVLAPDAPRIGLVRGTWIESHEWGVELFATWHPAYVLRNQSERRTFYADVRDFFCA